MENNQKVKIIHGEHKGKVGVVTGVFWGANTAVIKTDDGEEIVVKPIEVATIDD